jgi:hypothetical protein
MLIVKVKDVFLDFTKCIKHIRFKLLSSAKIKVISGVYSLLHLNQKSHLQVIICIVFDANETHDNKETCYDYEFSKWDKYWQIHWLIN